MEDSQIEACPECFDKLLQTENNAEWEIPSELSVGYYRKVDEYGKVVMSIEHFRKHNIKKGQDQVILELEGYTINIKLQH